MIYLLRVIRYVPPFKTGDVVVAVKRPLFDGQHYRWHPLRRLNDGSDVSVSELWPRDVEEIGPAIVPSAIEVLRQNRNGEWVRNGTIHDWTAEREQWMRDEYPEHLHWRVRVLWEWDTSMLTGAVPTT